LLIAIVGGNLQGVEATYLAHKTGWEVRVIDRQSVVPAKGFCDQFLQLDVVREKNLGKAFKSVDLVIPALENEEALGRLTQWTRSSGPPFAFDPNAYSISSSKMKSDQLFAQTKVPIPLPWPECGFPVLAKPDVGSGSQGVTVLNDAESFSMQAFGSAGHWVLQEFIQGPSYSIEIIGTPARYVPLQVTDLAMDETYDCKRVLAPTDLPAAVISDFEQISILLANGLKLTGLMDVEVILHENSLKVLEIDARLPSQTPTAVYWSTGVNMVQMLGDLFLNKFNPKPIKPNSPQGVVYEHIHVSPGVLEVAGEHIMSGTDALRIRSDFFGADEAITNYAPDRDEWVATLIISADTRKTAWEKRKAVIADIRHHHKIETYRDSSPNLNIDFR
jgi:pyrrolysine biosynthesis protein PylC